MWMEVDMEWDERYDGRGNCSGSSCTRVLLDNELVGGHRCHWGRHLEERMVVVVTAESEAGTWVGKGFSGCEDCKNETGRGYWWWWLWWLWEVVVVASEPGLTRDSCFDGYAFYYLGEGNKYGSSLIEACQRRSQQKPAGWGAEA